MYTEFYYDKILKSCRSYVLFRALHQLTASQKSPCKQRFLLPGGIDIYGFFIKSGKGTNKK